MPFIPADAPLDVLSHRKGWVRVRNGADFGPAPHTLLPSNKWGCEIIETHTTPKPESITFTKGMQGCALERIEFNGKRFVKIFIPGVTETGPKLGERNKYVLESMLKIGEPWRQAGEQWPIVISPDVGMVSGVALKINSGTADRLLDKTIIQLIQAFADTPAEFMREAISTLTRQHTVQQLASVIIDGIKDPGLYDELNRPDFDMDSLRDTATCEIDTSAGNGKIGIYARHQKSKSSVQYWKPNTWYAYVGQTQENFNRRYQEHMRGSNKVAILNRASVMIRSFALCILGRMTSVEVFYLAEQVFLCLLGTYRSGLVDPPPGTVSPYSLANTQAAIYCCQVSDKVFAITGWIALLKRSSGLEGANTRSPLDELGERQAKKLWVRTDIDVKDFETQTSYTMAEFRRCVPRKTTHQKVMNSSNKKCFYLVKIYGPWNDREIAHLLVKDFRVSFKTSETSGETHPPSGSQVQMVFEVRLDGKPHPHSWARLPKIGPFEDWDQANSWALRYEWEYPEGSGNWRYGYAQTQRFSERRDFNVPGSLSRYAIGVSVLYWLFGADSRSFPKWIHRPAGSVRVVQAVYDYMTQVIHIEPQRPHQLAPHGTRSADDMKSILADHGINTKFKDMTNNNILNIKRNAVRTTCDLCFCRVPLAREGDFSVNCKREGDTCVNCRKWGLPSCTWTSGLVGYVATQPKQQGRPRCTPEELELFNHMFETLYVRKEAKYPGGNAFENLDPFALHKGGVHDESDGEQDEDEDADAAAVGSEDDD